MEEGYCLSKLCRWVVICCNSVVRDIFVLSSDLMSFQTCSKSRRDVASHLPKFSKIDSSVT